MSKKILLTTSYQPINDKLILEFKNNLLTNKKSYFLLPNATLIEKAHHQLFSTEGDIAFAGKICSFNNFVQLILKQANVKNTIIDKSTSIVIIASILQDLLNRNQLSYLSNFDHIEDMAPQLLNVVREIRHNTKAEKTIQQAGSQLSLREKDIMLICQRYYQDLHRLNLLDYEEAMFKATKLCAKKSFTFSGSLLVIAGFTYHRMQIKLIEELIKRFSEIVLVIHFHVNQELFFREQYLISDLLKLGFEILGDKNSNNTVSKKLFSRENKGETPGITVQGYNSKRLEVSETIRALKDLMLNQQIAAKDIAIVARNTAEYAGLLAYYSEQAGVPVQLSATKNLLQTMPVRKILQLLNIAIKDWSADEFLQLLTEDYIWPHQIKASLIANFVRVTPEGGPLSSWILACQRQQQYLAYRERHGKREEQQEFVLTYADLQEVERGLLFMENLWSDLPTSGDFQNWYAFLLNLVKVFGVEESITTHIQQLDKPLAEQLYGIWALVIKALVKQQECSSLWPTDMSIQTFYNVLKDVFKSYPVPEHTIEFSGIQFYNPLQIAGLSFKHLFVLGFNEGAWPSNSYGSWLHSFNDGDSSLPLQGKQDHRISEKLRLIRTLSVATDNLCLSYLTKDNQGADLMPSPYLSDIEEASKHYIVNPQSPRYFSLTPEKVYCAQERLMIMILEGNNDSIQPDVKERINTERMRFTNSNSVFNGVLSDQLILGKLADVFNEQTSFSTTMLEQYGKCPWSFFLQRVLKVKPLEPLSVGMTPLIRGNIIHSILAKFLQQNLNSTLNFNRISVYEQQIWDLLALELQDIQSQLTRTGIVWTEFESDRIFYILRLWLRNEIVLQGSVALKPANFEYAFSELIFGIDSVAMKIEGFIDRIDIDEESLVVYDYKSGQTPRLRDIEDGVAFQIPFYILAARNKYPDKKALGGGYYRLAGDFNRNSGMWHEDYLEFVQLNKRIGDKVSKAEWNRLFEETKEYALHYRRQIQNGQFKLEPKRPCPKYCPYRAICRMTPQLFTFLEAKNNEIHR